MILCQIRHIILIISRIKFLVVFLLLVAIFLCDPWRYCTLLIYCWEYRLFALGTLCFYFRARLCSAQSPPTVWVSNIHFNVGHNSMLLSPYITRLGFAKHLCGVGTSLTNVWYVLCLILILPNGAVYSKVNFLLLPLSFLALIMVSLPFGRIGVVELRCYIVRIPSIRPFLSYRVLYLSFRISDT